MNGNGSQSSTSPNRNSQSLHTTSQIGVRFTSPPYQNYHPGFHPNIHPGFQPIGLGPVGFIPQYNQFVTQPQMQLQQLQPQGRRIAGTPINPVVNNNWPVIDPIGKSQKKNQRS
jgi:hypothetical protein